MCSSGIRQYVKMYSTMYPLENIHQDNYFQAWIVWTQTMTNYHNTATILRYKYICKYIYKNTFSENNLVLIYYWKPKAGQTYMVWIR